MVNLLDSIQTLISSVLESGLIIVLAALLVGTVIKKWIPDTALQNKWIPTVNIVLGGFLGVVIPTCFPGAGIFTQMIYGAMCGVSASFLYDKVFIMFAKDMCGCPEDKEEGEQ